MEIRKHTVVVAVVDVDADGLFVLFCDRERSTHFHPNSFQLKQKTFSEIKNSSPTNTKVLYFVWCRVLWELRERA